MFLFFNDEFFNPVPVCAFQLKEIHALPQGLGIDLGFVREIACKHDLAESVVNGILDFAFSLNGETVLCWIGIDFCTLR